MELSVREQLRVLPDCFPRLFLRHHRYLMSEAPVPFKAMQTNVGEPVLRFLEVNGEAYVLFIDQSPRANWAHPCCYVLMRPDEKFPLVIQAYWPPSKEMMETYRMSPIAL